MSSNWIELKPGFKCDFGLLRELLSFLAFYLWLKKLTFPECYKKEHILTQLLNESRRYN